MATFPATSSSPVVQNYVLGNCGLHKKEDMQRLGLAFSQIEIPCQETCRKCSHSL